MPYFTVKDLPATIQNRLPKKAQEIYRKSFNYIWDSYRNPSDLPPNVSRVELAARVAWSQVKKKYKKKKNKWIKRERSKNKKSDISKSKKK